MAGGKGKCVSVSLKSSNSERCRRWRDKKKNDPVFREKERKRKKKERELKSEEQKQRDREKARIRMKNYRKKKEEIVGSLKVKHAIKTRKQTEEQRQKWRKYKINYRAKLGSQKKRRIREKDAERKREQRKMREKESTEIEEMKDDQTFATNAARRQAIFRAKKHLPNHPTKFAKVVEGIINHSSPRKREALSRFCLTPSKKKRLDFLETGMSSVKDQIKNLKISNEKQHVIRRRHLVHTVAGNLLKRYKKYQVSKEIGIRWATMVKWSTEGVDFERKQRSDALKSEDSRRIRDFYVQPHISVTHAEKKTVSKKLVQRHTLNQSKQETFKKFKEECSDVKVSENKFWSLKPKSVEPLRKGKFRSCLCEKCVNVELKLKALNYKFQSVGIKDKYQLSKTSLCKYSNGTEPRLECIRRQCRTCGTEKLYEHLGGKVTESSHQMVQWNQWENSKINGKQRKLLASHHSTVKELISEIQKDLKTLPAHLFSASWQYRQFAKLKCNLPNGNMLCVMDFAENFTVRQQDECQSAHWFAQQVTIHPTVCYYHPVIDTEDKTELVTHEIVHISADLLHDSHFVHHCFKDSINYLKEQGKEFEKIIQFTDGCSAQYKSKTPFMDLSCAVEDFGVGVERNFFGSGHGKGPADGCSGVVKSAVHRAMVAGAVINSARDFFDHCKFHLTKDDRLFKRTFHFVEGVNRTRPERTNAKTLAGTRKLHSVKGVAPGVLEVRNYTCTCAACLDPRHGRCVNDAYVESWKVCNIAEKKTKDQKKTKGDEVKKSKDKEKVSDQKMMKGDEVKKSKDKEKVSDQKKMKGDEVKKSKDKEKVSDQKKMKGDEVKKLKDKEKVSDQKKVKGDEVKKSKDKEMVTDQKTKVDEVKESKEEADSIIHQQNSLWAELQTCHTYEDIQDKVITCSDCLPLQKPEKVTFVSHGGVIDTNALGLLPDDFCNEAPALYPAIIYGDGNCLPRAASVLFYGTEEHHLELRTRIIKELVENEDKYLSDDYMSHGANKCTQRGIVKQFALFSEQFSGEKLTPIAVKRIYRAEVLSLCQSGSYMGIWQVAALANVLQAKVFSVYPKYGGQTVRKDLNRTFHPFIENARNAPVHILWSNTRGNDIPEREWRPNHFVPLLPTHEQDKDADSSSDIDLSDTPSSIDISGIIQSLEEFSDSPLLHSSSTPEQYKELISRSVAVPDQNPSSPLAQLLTEDSSPDNSFVLDGCPFPELCRVLPSVGEDGSLLLHNSSLQEMSEKLVSEGVSGPDENPSSPIAWLPAQDMSPEDLGSPVLSRELVSGVDDGSNLPGRCSLPEMSEKLVSEGVNGPDENPSSPVAWLPAQDMSPEDLGCPSPVLSRELVSGVDDGSNLPGRCSLPEMSEKLVSGGVNGPDENPSSPVAWLPAQDMSPEDLGCLSPVSSRELVSGADDGSNLPGRCSLPEMSEKLVSEGLNCPDENPRLIIGHMFDSWNGRSP